MALRAGSAASSAVTDFAKLDFAKSDSALGSASSGSASSGSEPASSAAAPAMSDSALHPLLRAVGPTSVGRVRSAARAMPGSLRRRYRKDLFDKSSRMPQS